VAGDEVVEMLEALGWESPPEVDGVARLSGGASAGLLGGKLRCVERVGRGRHGGVGGVAAELRFELAGAGLGGVEALAQDGNGLITVPTSGTGRGTHTSILAAHSPASATRRKTEWAVTHEKHLRFL
jgi:hypothetical protein